MSADHEKETEKAAESVSRSSSEVVSAKNEAGAPVQDDAAAVEYPKGPAFIMIVVALLLNVFMIALDQTIVATAIPKITDQFKGLEKVGWYASAYFMTFGGFQMTFGKVFKYFSLKTSFLVSMLIFEVGSLMCGVAKNSNTLIAGRAIAGLGGAGVATGAFVIVAFAIEPKMRATYQGLMAATYGVSAIAGPLLGGAFADKVTWRWCFYINLPIGGLTGAIMFFFFHVPASAKPQQATWKEKLIQLDPLGTILMMGAIISFILAMERGGQTESWGSSTVIGLIVGFVVILIAFAALQAYLGERGMMPWRILRMRSVWTGAVYQACFGGGYFIVLYYLPIYFQSVKGASPINSGVRNLPMIIPVVIASIVGGVWTTVTGRAAVVAVFGSILAIICSALLYTFDIGTPAGKWIGYQVIGGFGWGIAWMVSLVITQAYSKPEDMSTATAIVLFTQQLGGALGVAAAQSAFVNKLIHRLAVTAPNVNGLLVVGTGATQIRSTFPPTQVPAIVDAYMLGVKTAFILTIAYSALAVLISFCMDFRPLPAHREAQEAKKEVAKEEIAAAASSATPV